jgi:hypothetical protein
VEAGGELSTHLHIITAKTQYLVVAESGGDKLSDGNVDWYG